MEICRLSFRRANQDFQQRADILKGIFFYLYGNGRFFDQLAFGKKLFYCCLRYLIQVRVLSGKDEVCGVMQFHGIVSHSSNQEPCISGLGTISACKIDGGEINRATDTYFLKGAPVSLLREGKQKPFKKDI